MNILHRHRTTLLFLAALFFLALFMHYGRIGASHNGIDLSTDAATYASIAAADTVPEAFVNDPLYDDQSRYGVHATAMTALIPFFAQDSHFGLAYLAPTGVQFFVHAAAFYALGLFLLGRPWQAILFTLIMSQTYWTPFGTYWGNGYTDYLPRSTFEMFYAVFIIVALRIGNMPKLWPFFMGAIGLMAYVHSISTLPAALGFWLGFALCRTHSQSLSKQSLPKHLLWLFFCGLCFIAVISPIIVNFMRPGIALSHEDVTLFRDILRIRFNPEFTHYWWGIKKFFVQYSLFPLMPIGIVAFFCLRTWGTAEEKARAAQFAMYSLAVVICIVLFIADQELGWNFDRKPFEFDLIRVIRFFVFFAACLGFMACNVIYRTFQTSFGTYKKHIITAYTLAATFFFVSGFPHKFLTSLEWYWARGDEARSAQTYAHVLQRQAILHALSEHTHTGDVIFDPNGDRAIRYHALRGLVYSWQDCSLYYYAKDVTALRIWNNIQKTLKESPTAYMALAQEHKADFLVSHRPQDREALLALGHIVWESHHALLVKLHKNKPLTNPQ